MIVKNSLLALVLTGLIILVSLPSQAQNNPFNYEESKASLITLDQLNRLAELYGIRDENDAYYFREMFSSDSVMIVNEVLPANKINEPISVDAYIQEVKQYKGRGPFTTYKLHPTELKIISRTRKDYTIEVTAEKEIGMNSKNQDFFRDTLTVKYTILFDRKAKTIKVRAVEKLYPGNMYLIFRLPGSMANNDNLGLTLDGQSIDKNLKDGILIRIPQKAQTLSLKPSSPEFLGSIQKSIDPNLVGPAGTYDGKELRAGFRPKKIYIAPRYFSAAQNGGHDHQISLERANGGSFQDGAEFWSNQTGFGVILGYRFLNFNDQFFLSGEVSLGQKTINYYTQAEKLAYSFDSSNVPGFNNVQWLVRGFSFKETGTIEMNYMGFGLNAGMTISNRLKVNLYGSYQLGLSPNAVRNNYEALVDYRFLWPANGANVWVGGNTTRDLGTIKDELLTVSEAPYEVEAINWFEIGLNLSFQINRRIWLTGGSFWNRQNISINASGAPTRFSGNFNGNATNTKSLNQLINNFEGLNNLGYQFGIKIYI